MRLVLAHEFVEADRVDAAEPSRASGRRAAADRCQDDRASAAPGVLPGVRGFDRGRVARWVAVGVRRPISRPRSSRSRCATGSRDATRPSSSGLFGVEVSAGTVDAIVQRAGDALAAPHTRLEQEIKRSAVVNIDETGWKTGGERRMLWGALTRRTAVFRIAAGRHAAEAQTMLGEHYDGIVCSDRWAGYDYLDSTRRQLCWAHLLRDFTAHSEGMAEQAELGNAGLAVTHDLFDAWRHFQHDADRAALQARIAPLRRRLRTELSTPHAKPEDEIPPAVRAQPAQALARPLDLQPHRRRRADQQPRRTGPPRRRHLPQALTRHPIRTRRTQPRTTPLGLDHLPPTKTIAPRLPHRSHDRPRPRRPDTRPQLTTKRAERLRKCLELQVFLGLQHCFRLTDARCMCSGDVPSQRNCQQYRYSQCHGCDDRTYSPRFLPSEVPAEAMTRECLP